MNLTPNDLIALMKSGNNPQQIIMNYLSSSLGNTPMGKNLLTLAQAGNTKEIEKIARNLAQSRGLDFDKEFSAFQQNFRR